MANFARIAPTLESIINIKLNATRRTQGVWEWYNALFRVMSANRFGDTPTIYGPIQLSSGTNVVETVATKLFGVLIDNSMASEDLQLAVYNAAATPGTTNTLGLYWGLRAAMLTYVIPEPTVQGTRLEVSSTLGTQVGEAAGTASTTQPTVLLVYTK